MSNAALVWAWGVPCSPTCKLVLVAIADRANEAGECFPSVRDVMQRTGLKERAVQYAVQDLERAGWLRREFRTGRATIYVVSLDRQTPASDAPPHEMHPRTTCTGGVHHMHRGGAPHAPITLIEPKDNPHPLTESGERADALTLTPKAKREPGGTRLPGDWHPSTTLEGFAVGLGLNADAVAAQFRDYWHAAPGAKGRKADWDATWRNWCRREAERQPRAQALPLKTSQWSVDQQNDEIRRLVGRAPETLPLMRIGR